MSKQYTCVSCLIKQGQRLSPRDSLNVARDLSPLRAQSPRQKLASLVPPSLSAGWRRSSTVAPANRAPQKKGSHDNQPGAHSSVQHGESASHSSSTQRRRGHGRSYSSVTLPDKIKLGPLERRQVIALSKLGKRLNHVAYSGGITGTGEPSRVSMDVILQNMGAARIPANDEYPQEQARLLETIGTRFAGEQYGTVKAGIDKLVHQAVTEPYTADALGALTQFGILTEETPTPNAAPQPRPQKSSTDRNVKDARRNTNAVREDITPKSPSEDEASVPPNTFQTLKAVDQVMAPFEMDEVTVPKLSFDLSRVLFNPGVYELQDPRSRVYNFDPYLQKIMPVNEFNFEALNKYITSSEDHALRNLALHHRKRYIGSSSSMTGTLAHFHFLLSGWRPLNVDMLSKGFKAESDNFTKFQRTPSAAFLRWQDGVYAMDADKEFDSSSVLTSLGRSMEKLLTLEKQDYEKLRRSNAIELGQWESPPEQYHYGGLSSFLMRSQLDAHDPRLPGTGMFDLKTRAVVAVRMTMGEMGTGYEIKTRHGTWESFEREFYDMIRSAFLKYSLQVRMGRMDGIFVAYHNIERIFGFQYISLPEMDIALHGQKDTTLGDQEFGLSVSLLERIFDRATAAFPKQSLRFHFETRESFATKSDAKPWMYIFAEPVSEEEVARIQTLRKDEIKAAEERILSGVSKGSASPKPSAKPSAESLSNAADSTFLDSLANLTVDVETPKTASQTSKSAVAPLLGLKLVVQNVVDGRRVARPNDVTKVNNWELEYSLTEIPEAQAQTKYAQCKVRRSITHTSAREEDLFAESYISRLISMSNAGAAWRKERDEMDARKERVVLYGVDGSPNEPMRG